MTEFFGAHHRAVDEARWPERPYKGFGAYGPDDVLLFSGRDDDIRRLSLVLADSKTRIVFLHGKTGCGKSSFLRAGLIPYIEKNIGIEFMRSARWLPCSFAAPTSRWSS